MIVLDSGVLIAFANPADAWRTAAERILTTTEPLAVTAMSGAEVMVQASSDDRQRWQDLLRAFAIEVVPITSDDMDAIAEVRRTCGLKMPDALVLWLALARAAAVASFDRRLLDKAGEFGLRTISGEAWPEPAQRAGTRPK
jgi:predicted nucleic acid-binding protein